MRLLLPFQRCSFPQVLRLLGEHVQRGGGYLFLLKEEEGCPITVENGARGWKVQTLFTFCRAPKGSKKIPSVPRKITVDGSDMFLEARGGGVIVTQGAWIREEAQLTPEAFPLFRGNNLFSIMVVGD